MNEYVIITDATVDLPTNLIEELGITVIPMEFTVGDTSYSHYPDEREMKMKDFYDLLRNGEMSKTSQINITKYEEVFESFLKDGKDILYIALSSGLSGTYNSSRLAMEDLGERYPDREMHTVDSLCASMGEGLMVYTAHQMKQSGMKLGELFDWLEENKYNMCQWFTVDDLMFLKRSGRVSSTAAVVGTMLGIKPVLHVNDTGHLIPLEKVRGRSKALSKLVEKMEKACTAPSGQTIFISHGDCEEDAKKVATMISEKLPIKSVFINTISPVVGSHSGPGTIALFFFGNKKIL